MNTKKIRTALINLILKHERLFRWIFVFIISLVCFLVINKSYGYMGIISKPWIALVVSVFCGFLPLNAVALLIFIFITAQLFGLSTGLAIIYIVINLIFFIVSKTFGSKGVMHMSFLPVLYRIHVPFISPLYAGFFGKKRDIAPLMGGAVLAFYMRTIRLQEAAFKSADDEINSLGILKDSILLNNNFYVFLMSVAAMFLIIQLVKNIRVEHSWLFACLFSVIVEFMAMLFGFMFSNSQSQISTLVISNAITLAIGLLIVFFLGEHKVNRRKYLEFEDDEYTYLVTCIPKLQIEESKKRVVRITRSRREIEAEKRRMEQQNEAVKDEETTD